MIRFENNQSWNNYRRQQLSGKISGIWTKPLYGGNANYPIFPYKYLTSNFCDFEKNIYSINPKVVYHLSGYGKTFNESLVSYIGESSERYAYALSKVLLESRIEYASYDEMKNSHPDDIIVSLDYINVGYLKNVLVKTSDKIKWVKMNSLHDYTKSVWMPLQFVVLYSNEVFDNEKRYNLSGVSTGTAGQETFLKSLLGAITEYLQIDSFNLWWYGGVKAKELPDDKCKKTLERVFEDWKLKELLKSFSVKFLDISFDKPVKVVLCEIYSKSDNLPKYTVGVQGGMSLEKCIYRSFMEALTVLEYSMNLCWYDSDRYINLVDKNSIDNLDDNIILYARTGKPKIVQKNFSFKENCSNGVTDILGYIKQLSIYGGYLNITPPEFSKLNLNVTRVIIPELLPICLPSFPAYTHPRFKQYGGVINHYAHPLA